MRAHAIQHAEINYFGVTTLVLGHFIHRDAVDIAGGFGVNIKIAVEIFDQFFIIRQNCRQTQLKLLNSRPNEHIALFGHECLANLAAKFGADRDILQVRRRT